MATARNAYMSSMVTTASPEKLLVMLYDRLVLDLQRAAAFQDEDRHPEASAQLLHAQEIVLELASSLRLDAWEGAPRLASIYNFLHRELVRANVERSADVTRSCLVLVEPLAAAWRQAALVGVDL